MARQMSFAFKAGQKSRGLKKGFRFERGGGVVKVRAKTKAAPKRKRTKSARRKSSCVAFKLPPRGRGGKFRKR